MVQRWSLLRPHTALNVPRLLTQTNTGCRRHTMPLVLSSFSETSVPKGSTSLPRRTTNIAFPGRDKGGANQRAVGRRFVDDGISPRHYLRLWPSSATGSRGTAWRRITAAPAVGFDTLVLHGNAHWRPGLSPECWCCRAAGSASDHLHAAPRRHAHPVAEVAGIAGVAVASCSLLLRLRIANVASPPARCCCAIALVDAVKQVLHGPADNAHAGTGRSAS